MIVARSGVRSGPLPWALLAPSSVASHERVCLRTATLTNARSAGMLTTMRTIQPGITSDLHYCDMQPHLVPDLRGL
jgi:hypothetical protein